MAREGPRIYPREEGLTYEKYEGTFICVLKLVPFALVLHDYARRF